MRRAVLVLLTALVAGGCDQTATGFRIATAEVVPSEVSFQAVGQTRTLEVRVTDRNGEPVFGVRTVWSSADTAVATVSSDGEVTAVAPGATTITAAISGLRIVDATARASVVVQAPAAVR